MNTQPISAPDLAWRMRDASRVLPVLILCLFLPAPPWCATKGAAAIHASVSIHSTPPCTGRHIAALQPDMRTAPSSVPQLPGIAIATARDAQNS
eukprot:1661132-Rhodomonas_salina.1